MPVHETPKQTKFVVGEKEVKVAVGQFLSENKLKAFSVEELIVHLTSKYETQISEQDVRAALTELQNHQQIAVKPIRYQWVKIE